MLRKDSLATVLPRRGATFSCDASLRYEKLWSFGAPPFAWTGAADAELFPEDVAARLVAAKEGALRDARVTCCVETLAWDGGAAPWAFYFAPDGDGLRGLVLEVDGLARLLDERDTLRHLGEVASDYGYVVKVGSGGGLEIEWAAAALSQTTGYTLEELHSRGGWPSLVHPEDVGLLQRELEAVGRGRFHAGEFRIVSKAGEVRWVCNRAKVLPEGSGALRIVGAARDITDQKSAEDEARRLHDELAHVARLSTLGEMASGIAHELNQPLAAIINHADACAMGLANGVVRPDVVRRDLEQIVAQAERAAAIIRRLRSLVARREPRRESVDINRCVEDVFRLLETVARRRGVTLTIELGELSATRADPVQIQQVVMNLVQNAIDAVAEREPPRRRVRVATRATPAGAEVAVDDWAGPLAPEVLERVFDPFFSTKTDGLGIGLTICRTVVESHGGRLSATARGDDGTRFCFVLP